MAATSSENMGNDSALAKSLVQEVSLFRLIKRKSLVGQMINSKSFTVKKDKQNPSLTFMTTKGNAPVIEKTALEGTIQKGGRVQIRLADKLYGDGVTGRETLSGKGEALGFFTQNLELEKYRHAVETDDLSERYAIDNLSQEHKDALEEWGTEKLDKLAIAAWTASPTRVAALASGTPGIQTTLATAQASLTTDDTLQPKLIQYMTTYAASGGVDSDRYYKKIKPIDDFKGADVQFVLIVHPHACYNLKRNSEYRQEVRERMKDDYFFKNAVAIIDGVVIIQDDEIPLFTTTNNVTGCQGIFTGAQSLALAWGAVPYMTQEDRDHNSIHEVGWNMIAKVQKVSFNSIDWNSMNVAIACDSISG